MNNVIRLECRNITPMFLTGADTKTPELRAPSFKGAMRFWWRAVQAESGIVGLRKREMSIFGGTGQRSSFFIRVSNKENKEINKVGYRPLPHHIGDGCPYCNDSKIPCANSKGRRQCAIVDTQFILFIGDTSSSSVITHDELKALFLLTSILGGVGKRSRRGFGSFRVVTVDGEEQPEIVDLVYIMSLLDVLTPNKYKILENRIIPAKSDTRKYPCIEEVAIGEQERDMDVLLKKIGQASHDCNSRYTGRGSPRLASPLCVSVILSDQSFLPVVTTLTTITSIPLSGSNTQTAFKRAVLL